MKQLRLAKIMRRVTMLTVFAAGVLVSAVSVVPAPTVSAGVAAFDCSAWQNSAVQANARCNLGLGGVRAWADCYHPTFGTMPRKYGPIKPVGSISSVICYSGTYVQDYGYQIQ